MNASGEEEGAGAGVVKLLPIVALDGLDCCAKLCLYIGKEVSVDAKINTLESEGKCSPSHGKSTKRASQFDLKLTREKTKSNSRAYRLGFRISLRWAYRQALPIL